MNALWYGMVVWLAGRLRHREAGVSIGESRAGLELHYHALGGALARRVVADARFAWLDSEQVHLPGRIDRYAQPALNRELYFWLAAFLALDRPVEGEDLLPAGVRHLLRGVATSARVAEEFPALAQRYRRLCAAELAQRATALPGWDAARTHPVLALEAAIRYALGSPRPPRDEWMMQALDAARRGRTLPRPLPHVAPFLLPFLPVPLWGHKDAARWSPFKRRRRRRTEGMPKPLGLPRFDPQHPADPASGEPARGTWVYPEWACQRSAYRPGWCKVTEPVPTGASDACFDASCVSRAARVRAQFEALRQQPGWSGRRESGEALDLDAYVESAGDARGCGYRSARIFRQRAPRWRSLSVAALMDSSRSTEAWVGEHRVIGIAREGMLVLAEALSAAGDDFGLFAFASDSRLRVRCSRIKDFDEAYGAAARHRLLALKPGHYTRMGAAIRHVGARLDARPAAQRLLLVLTDGRPNDPMDGYEGRYGLEDTRRALLELRARGVHCFGLAIDRRGRDYLPRLFGSGRYALLSDPQSLPRVLPQLYARMTLRAH